MLIAGGRSSVAWATTKPLVRTRDIVLGTHRVAGGDRNAFDRCGSDAVVDRRETPVGSSDHARHSFRAGATEGSADVDREHGGRGGGSAADHTRGSKFPGVADS